MFRNNNSDDDDFSPSEIDTFTKEELDKARNAFRQFNYIDTINDSYILDYNLFIPENYTKEKKYPLIMFIHDGSFVQKTDVKSTLTDTVGGPIWATDREQKKKGNALFLLRNIMILLLMIIMINSLLVNILMSQ